MDSANSIWNPPIGHKEIKGTSWLSAYVPEDEEKAETKELLSRELVSPVNVAQASEWPP